MSYSASAETIEVLAANIGDVVYMDVAKWHLYLNDAKLHTLVAQRLYPMVEGDRIDQCFLTFISCRYVQPVTQVVGQKTKIEYCKK